MRLTANAQTVLESRYLQKDASGEPLESPEQLFQRVAKGIAAVEEEYGGNVEEREAEFLELLRSLRFLPNSPTLMNAGLDEGQLSACYVLPVEDSIDSIFEALKNTALIQQSGGGTGFNFSALRPKNSYISSSGGKATGPLSFMKLFSESTETIKQGGTRRGANMGILNISHPDIADFIGAKQDEGTLRNFNISVGMSDRFMEVLEAGGEWPLQHPRSDRSWEIPAQELWEALIENAWRTGDPGLIFLDRLEEANPVPALGPIQATNPCGEVPLQPYESCNLGSIDLAKCCDEEGAIQEELLKSTVRTAVRFLDNVIDANHYPTKETARMAHGNRKIGLGVMGWADLLIRAGIPYASQEAIDLAERVMQLIQNESFEASKELAEERGVFPNWEKSRYAPDRPIRNATRTSIAPTGTISTIAGTTPSIEPLYALAYRRSNVLEEEVLLELDPVVQEHLRKKGLDTPERLERIREKGSLEGSDIPEESRELLRTALEIPYSFHIEHQIAFQRYTDNAVSKTINLPEDASRDDVATAYRRAWQEGAKGITIYRDRSKSEQVLEPGVEGSRKASCEVCTL